MKQQGKWVPALDFPGNLFIWRSRDINTSWSATCLPLCLHVCDQRQQSTIRIQIPSICPHGSQKLCEGCFRSTFILPFMGLEGEVAALNLELKWTKITFNLPSKPASASLSEKFYQTDSTYVIVVFRRQISGGSYCNILTETSSICFFFQFSDS